MKCREVRRVEGDLTDTVNCSACFDGLYKVKHRGLNVRGNAEKGVQK